ncbi:MAG TPA: ATP-binding protein [Candidatus Eisenbacteria bacterium]
MRTPPRVTQRAAAERLWRRAEEIRSLCGLPAFTGEEPGAPEGADPVALEPLVEILLRDLESNFRRELATRVQLEGLAELVAFAARDAEPGRSYQILVNYLARALDEPRLWLGVLDGSPPVFTVFRAGDPALVDVSPERVQAHWLHPDWLRWVALGEGEEELWAGPSGSRKGGPWRPVPIRGEIAVDRLTGEVPICPGAVAAGGSCGLSRLPLEDMAGGHRACGRCQFRHIVALIGVEGKEAPERRAQLQAVAPSLGAILVNLGLKEALDLEARFRDGVIENLPLGVVAIDTRGRVLAWNRAAESIIGLDIDQVRATPIPRLLPERSWHDALIESMESGETSVGAEHDVIRPDGTSLPAEVSTAPLKDAEGRIRGAVATLLDVSSLRRMEDRIRQLDRLAALGRFASSVAHELRNPLTGIATGVQYLSRGFPEGDERHESVAFILREVIRLNTIIQDLFTATKPRDLNLRPARLGEVLALALRGIAPHVAASGVRIDVEDADHWPVAMVDADQIQQVFLNLIQNAVQATPAGGTVTLRARQAGDGRGVVVEVADTGPGIAPEHLPRIFEPFYTTRPKGTGLGLFVAHGIVQHHGGTLEVESEQGRGTRFRIVLPGAQA